MFKQVIVLIVFSILFCTKIKANNYVYDYNDNCINAYYQYLSLNLEEGRAYIIKEIKANPYNLMATFYSDYEDFLVLFLNCNKQDYAQLKEHLNTRIALLDNGDKSSPWFRFCKAGVYMHWTMIYLRFGENLKAALTFRKSYALLKENRQMFPDFEYNSIFTGIEEAVVGSLSGNYRWIASVLGVKGSVKTGINKLSTFVNRHNDRQPLYIETEYYYQFTRFYFLGEKKEVWDVINSAKFHIDGNLLNAFMKTYVALDYNKSDEAINTINLAAKEKNFNKYPFFDFQMGMAKFTNLDSSCLIYFARYLANNKSNFHIKDAWQKMAYYKYINGDIFGANYCRQQAGKEGGTQLDVDKQAARFAETKTWPQKQMLQARVLIDGGYFLRALTILKKIELTKLVNVSDISEYYYRLGLVYEETGESSKALAYFRNAKKAGVDNKEQFAARASLHIGLIYEHTGDKKNAILNYKETLKMQSHDFQSSIDQQAKAGINRLD